jgi:hypothetical protein
LSVLVAAMLILSWSTTSLAAAQHDAGLAVQGALAEYSVTPGQTLTHKVQVQLGPDAAPLDMLVDPSGLGQAPDGSPMALSAADDKSPYSARTYLQSVEPRSFHLAPGQSVTVNATIAVPTEQQQGRRYADVYIHSKPSGGGRVGIVLAAHVPVILRIGNPRDDESGKITALRVDRVVPGHPIAVSTSFENTGESHFKAENRVSLFGPNGSLVGTQSAPLTTFSIVPTFTRQFTVSFGLLDQVRGLPAGKYVAESNVLGADGKVIDTQRASFDLAAPYEPFPGIDPDSLVVVHYNNEVPYPIDAREKAGVNVAFSGTDVVTGVAVVGRFKGEAPGEPRFDASPDDGGMGQVAIKYLGVGVQGFSKGNAKITASYTSSEVPSGRANSLYLAYRVGKKWAKLENLAVFSGAQNVQGDLPVAILNQNPVIALALDEAPKLAAVPTTTAPTNDLLHGIDPLVAAGVGGSVAIALVAGILLLRTPRAPVGPADPRKRSQAGPPSGVGRSDRVTTSQLANRGSVTGPPRLPEGGEGANQDGDSRDVTQ